MDKFCVSYDASILTPSSGFCIKISLIFLSSAISLADSEDAILFFSYSGSTRDMCDTLNIVSQRNVPVILITHFPKSAGAELATVVLQCGYNESPLQSGSVAAKVGQLFIYSQSIKYCTCYNKKECANLTHPFIVRILFTCFNCLLKSLCDFQRTCDRSAYHDRPYTCL